MRRERDRACPPAVWRERVRERDRDWEQSASDGGETGNREQETGKPRRSGNGIGLARRQCGGNGGGETPGGMDGDGGGERAHWGGGGAGQGGLRGGSPWHLRPAGRAGR